jgi:hypothetical protein
MSNVIHTVCSPLLIWSTSQRTRWSLDPTLWWITGITLFLFQFRIQIHIHAWVKLSCYSVLIWVQHSWCCGEDLFQSGRLWRGCWHFVCSSSSARNCQFSTSPGVFFRYRIYIFPREEGHVSCLRLTQGVTPTSTTRLYRCYVNWG